MKAAPVAWLMAAFAVGIPLSMRSQSPLEHAPSLPSSMDLYPARQTAPGASASATPDPESKTDERDDMLYRGKTSDSETTMLRDEGALHFKTRPKERIKEVDSLKNLQSSGTDPKFQGSFATSGVSSIDKVAVKANEPAEAGAAPPDRSQADRSQDDSRFTRKQMAFTPPEENKTSKAGADSSPSPTPSPSASPAKKKSTDGKQ